MALTPEQLIALARASKQKATPNSPAPLFDLAPATITLPPATVATGIEATQIVVVDTTATTPTPALDSTTSKPAATTINCFELQQKIAALQEALLTAHPRMPMLLRDIHTQLREDPELVTVLAEEDICAIVRGLKVVTNTEIATATVKNTTTAKLKKANINVDMF